MTTPPPKPIRVGILGLSTKASAWATLAHWPYLSSSPDYQIVAVCNSSLESTKAAIEHFKLPATTKAYETYDALASDPDVDLYVVSTRADTHYSVALPGLKAGKSVYVEWPLGANLAQAQQMLQMANENGCRTIVGLQGRVSPSVLKVKSVVDSGRLGEIHSVSYIGTTNVWQDNAAGERYSYFMDRKVGGNLLTIYGGHVLDSVLHAVGPLDYSTVQNLAGNFRKTMKVKKSDGTYSEENHPKDTPDQMMLIGRLKRDPPAMFNFHLRAGDKFIGHPGSVWRIYGTKAELHMRFSSAGPQIGKADSIQISDFTTGQVEDVEWDEGGPRWTSMPTQGQNIGRLYEAFAQGRHAERGAEGQRGYADWADAVKLHELIDSFYNNMA